MRVAYLINQYPRVSHTFIRREILSLEEEGIIVDRYSIRGRPGDLVDEEDLKEMERTRVILDGGLRGLVEGLLRCGITNPIRLARATRLAIELGWASDRGLLLHLAYLAEACVLLGWCKEQRCEHLHAHFGTNSTTVAMLCHMLGGPRYSFTVHGFEEFEKPIQIRLKEKIEQSKFVAGISSFGRSQLYRRVGHDQWPKVKVVRCGLDQTFIDAEPTPVPDVPRFVCVGRICEQKGQLLLCEAVARLSAEGRDVELVLVGDGEMRGDVEALIESEGLQQQIHITGWASGERVRQELSQARAMVLPSFIEGLPVVIMEALALGRPVVSTYIAGIPELVVPGVSGWLVPAGSVDALVDALGEVLDTSPEELTRKGMEGRSRVIEDHDALKNARQLKRLFAEVDR